MNGKQTLIEKANPAVLLNDFLQILFSRKSGKDSILKDETGSVPLQRTKVLSYANTYKISDELLTYILKHSHVIRELSDGPRLTYEWILHTSDRGKPNINTAKDILKQFTEHKARMVKAHALKQHLLQKYNASMHLLKPHDEHGVFMLFIEVLYSIEAHIPINQEAITEILDKYTLDPMYYKNLFDTGLITRHRLNEPSYWKCSQVDPYDHINTKFIRAYMKDAQNIKSQSDPILNIKKAYPNLFKNAVTPVCKEIKRTKWSIDEDSHLVQLSKAGHDVVKIASMMCRTEDSIRVRLYKLNLKPNNNSKQIIMETTKKTWTDADVKSLIALVKNGATVTDIAKDLGRSNNAIQLKVSKMNQKLPKKDRLSLHGCVDKEKNIKAAAAPVLPPAAQSKKSSRWTPEELDMLVACLKDSMPVSDIASVLERTDNAVIWQIVQLNKKLPKGAPKYKMIGANKESNGLSITMVANSKAKTVENTVVTPRIPKTEEIYNISKDDLHSIKSSALAILNDDTMPISAIKLAGKILNLSLKPIVS